MQFLKKLKRYKEGLLDLLYPKVCFICKKHVSLDWDGYICQICLNKIGQIEPPFCISCGRPIINNEKSNLKCVDCLGYKYYFSRGHTSAIYEGILKDCIHSFKYSSHVYLGNSLAIIMAEFAKKYIELKKIDAIIPVPLHWKKLRDRGFNQAEILGRKLSKEFNIPCISNSLNRIKAIQPQIQLHRDKRFNNVYGAFSVVINRSIVGKRILLIDDVFTTGATFNECSKTLLENGVKDVWIFSLARGMPV